MERASPPSLAAAALAEMDEGLSDTPLSPKRPRQDDPPSQVGTRAGLPPPRTTANATNKAAMLAAASMQQHLQHNTQPHQPHHTSGTLPKGRPPGWDPTQPRYRPRAPARGAGPVPSTAEPQWGNAASSIKTNCWTKSRQVPPSRGTGAKRKADQEGCSPTPTPPKAKRTSEPRARDRRKRHKPRRPTTTNTNLRESLHKAQST
mmetsp:Transcript_104907/g.145071  ORF Transcript_104907/g.145071 Transcript_104907/m.145071 type:complete len:204 (+) Transcript_104907:34-645(+)